MRNIVKTTKEIRQEYLQQYLKLFLRRVHPDLFQSHPKEQLRNSTSLQELLPLVAHDKRTGSNRALATNTSSGQGKTAQLLFYYRPKDQLQNTDPPSATSLEELRLAEHSLPLPGSVPSLDSDPKQASLEDEVKSWELVQSFVQLCNRVGVAVKAIDQDDIAARLQESLTEAKAKAKTAQKPQKPLSEVFVEELQGSFAGSAGNTGGPVSDSAVSENMDGTHLGKMGRSVPALDAEVMIHSNPLLFKSPDLTPSRLSRVVRSWIHWQDEDKGQKVVEDHLRFQLGHWWRKVPVMVLSSPEQRERIMNFAKDPGNAAMTKGMLIVDPSMSKEDMVEYISSNLDKVQRDYKKSLQAASSATQFTPTPPTAKQVRQQSSQEIPKSGLPPMSYEAASYLERMKARSTLDKIRRGYNGGRNKRR